MYCFLYPCAFPANTLVANRIRANLCNFQAERILDQTITTLSEQARKGQTEDQINQIMLTLGLHMSRCQNTALQSVMVQ